MKSKRVNEPAPSGGDYSEIFYLNNDNEPVESEEATRCIIRECKEDGTLVNETFGSCN